MLEQQIDGLRFALIEEKDLNRIANAFLDITEQYPIFVMNSQPVLVPEFSEILAHTLRAFLPTGQLVVKIRAFEYTEQKLVHGTFNVNTGLGLFFYFTDLPVGLGSFNGHQDDCFFRIKILPEQTTDGEP